MQQSTVSVSEYLTLLKDGEDTQAEFKMPTLSQIKETQPRAVEILSVMAYLDRHEIPKAMKK